MKTSLFPALFLVLLSGSVTAQQAVLNVPKRIPVNAPLVLIDSMETDFNYLIINPNNIEKINVLKDDAGIKAYGDKAKNGVIYITTKQNVVMSRLNAILDKFHIAPQNRQLQVCIDKILVKDPSKIIFDDTEIEQVEITTERIWNYPEEQPGGEKYINIITRKSSGKTAR